MYREGCFTTPCPHCSGILLWSYDTEESRRNCSEGAILCNTCKKTFSSSYSGFPSREPVFLPEELPKMSQRRAEEISFVFLKSLLTGFASDSSEYEFPAGLPDEEFCEFLKFIAPEFEAKIMAEVTEEFNPLEHLDEILHGVAEKLQADAALPHRGSECPYCKKGKIEFPVEHGLYDLSYPWLVCDSCGSHVPRPGHSH